MKKLLSLLTLFLLIGGGNLWADTFIWDLSENSTKAKETTNDIIKIVFGGSNLSNQKTYMGFKNGSTLSVSSDTGYTITKIAFSYTTEKQPTSNSFTADPTGLNEACTEWVGNASNISIKNTTSNNDTYITKLEITYQATSATNTYTIPIEDLRFEHQTYNPSRSNIAGFNITTQGWQSYTTVSGNASYYTLLLSDREALINNSITITPNSQNNDVKIRQVVLYGGNGATTFNNATVTSQYTRKDNTVGALVWENSTGANSATISIQSTDRPHIHTIIIITDNAMTWQKQDVNLTFTPATGTASVNQNDLQIDGRVIINNSENFRADDFTVVNSNSNAKYNQYHISTSKVGIDTGNSAGTATIKAVFNGNQFYNQTESSDGYTLTITNDAPQVTTFTIDDMRISKKMHKDGLNAKDNNLDRTMGGFELKFTGDENVKFNNSDHLVFSQNGELTITPQKTDANKTVTISRIDITTLNGYTGSVKVNNENETSINNVSSYSFSNLDASSFTLKCISGNVYITGFTIYYTDTEGTLKKEKITPTLSFSASQYSGTASNFSSPTIQSISPKNFDFSITSSDNNVATVATSNWNASTLVALQGAEGTATITASAAESTFFNVATPATYQVTISGTDSKKWDFTTLDSNKTINTTEWDKSGEYYKNLFKTSATTKNVDANSSNQAYYTTNNTESQIYGLKFGRENSGGLGDGQIRLYNSYMAFNNSAVVIAVPVQQGQNVIITFDSSDGSTKGFDFTNATLEDNKDATSFEASATKTSVTLTATATGYVTLKETNSKIRIYTIEVKYETRSTLKLEDTSNSYERYVGKDPTQSNQNNHFNHRVKFTPADNAPNALTYATDKGNLHITSSDPNVLDVSNAYVSEGYFGQSSSFYFNNIIPKGAGTATLTVTFDGNNGYKPTSYESAPYSVYGPIASFNVKADDQRIQQGQQSVVYPVITDTNGHPLGIKQDNESYIAYALGEDEPLPDYSSYFDFTYTPVNDGSGTNPTLIQVNNGSITTKTDNAKAAVGDTRTFTVTAKIKSIYSSAVNGGTETTATTTFKLSIGDEATKILLNFYWDAECTTNHQVTGAGNDKDYQLGNGTYASTNTGVFGKSGTFKDGFPNGRMLYITVTDENPNDSIYFSYAVNKDAEILPAHPNVNSEKRIFKYRRGIPIYIDDDDITNDSYVCVNVVATTWDDAQKQANLHGVVAKMKFNIIDHTDHERPDKPTYDPISPDENSANNNGGRKIMNTAQNVVAFGENATSQNPDPETPKNLVYGKFSTASTYTTEQLINEETVSYHVNHVPVVSTEVNKRRFTSVQIKKYTTDAFGGYGEYVSEQTYTEYYYLFDTNLTLYSEKGDQMESTYRYDINITSSLSTATTESGQPSYKVTWYNKRNFNNKNATGVTQEVDNYDGKVVFQITGKSSDDMDATIDEKTGVVTARLNTGWVKVTATYLGGEEHGGKSGEPQYVSTTDKSTATFYVYISDPAKETPKITPPSRKFTKEQTFTVTAPETWNTYYITTITKSGETITRPTVENLTEGNQTIIAKTSESKTIGKDVGTDMQVGDKLTVWAVAYNGSNTYSEIVSETYEMVKALPDPIFDPDGTQTPYKYNTNELTVQISCPYASAEIYYTITEMAQDAEYPDPKIGAAHTRHYSGLEKVTVTGDMTIKAIAYDPIQDIFSNVVTSVYQYSDVMYKPYFQISDDGGVTWKGYDSENGDESSWKLNGTKWYNAQEREITPSTQIRIVDPNPVRGTIYYTLDNSSPSADATSLVYQEGYPFTVGKTVTGKAITVLQDAKSEVSTAKFTIANHNVWEAVNETTPEESDKHGMRKADGFVISTNASLSVANTATTVNKNSISTAKDGKASKMYAQEHITATFGGYDLEDWEEMTIADAAIGTPLDAVGDYSIKSTNNAQDEEKKNYNHKNSYEPTTTYGKTFKLPARGTYVRFEPERDGDLTIWVLQQGALNYEQDKYLVDNYIRLRPVYLVDEQGKSYKVKEVNGVPQLWSAARLSENWSKIAASEQNNRWADYTDHNDHIGVIQYIRKSDGAVLQTKPDDYEYAEGEEAADGTTTQAARETDKYLKIVNKGPNAEESKAIYKLFNDDLTKNHVNTGDPIKPFAIHTGSTISLNDGINIDTSNDGTGYVLATGGYAKYTFEVKAGKTYFFFGQGTKIGVRGFQFVPSNDDSYASITIDEESANSSDTYKTDAPVDVTLKRTFTNKWTTLVLPFSVSTTQIEKVFGKQTDIIHFDQINGEFKSNIHMKRHWHKMIVAGTPVLIKPTNASTENPVFHGVWIERDNTEAETITDPNEQYDMLSTFTYQTAGNEKALKQNDYYINKNTGNFKKLTATSAAMKGTMAWLRPRTPEAAAKSLSISFASFFDDEDNTATGIDLIVEDSDSIREALFPANGNVYNLNGQMVSTGSLEGLRKGVYIVNGKKVVVE